MIWQKLKSSGWSMVRENISLRERVDALTWLISREARQQFDIARAHFSSWRRNRPRPSGQGVTPADRATLRATNPELQALRQRYAGLPDIIGTSPVWRRVTA